MKFCSIVLAIAFLVSFAGVADAGNNGPGSKGKVAPATVNVKETTPTAQVVTVATDATAATIEAHERKMLECYKTHDTDAFMSYFDTNCWTAGQNGFMPVSNVASTLNQYSVTNYAVAGFKTYCINPSTYFTTYTYTCNATYNGKEYPSGPWYCSSVWAKRGNDWKCAYRSESLGTTGSSGFKTPTPTASQKPAGKH